MFKYQTVHALKVVPRKEDAVAGARRRMARASSAMVGKTSGEDGS